MGCGASRTTQHEEDEYYEEESRSVQTSARLDHRMHTPLDGIDEGRTSKITDKSLIESDKWDTFEIASSDRGNTAKDSGYSRERSPEMKAEPVKGQMDHPNRVTSAAPRKEPISPPPRRRRVSDDDRYRSPPPPPPGLRRRYSPPPDYRRRGPPPPPPPPRMRRIPSRGYDSDPDDFDRQRRRRPSIDQVRRRRLDDDMDEGYRSDNSKPRTKQPPSGDRQKIPNQEQPRRPIPNQEQPRRPIQAQNNGKDSGTRIPRRPRSAPGEKRQQDNSAQSKLYQRRPIRSNDEQYNRTPPTSKDSMQRSQNNPKMMNDINKKKAGVTSVSSDPSVRIAGNQKKGQPPPAWKYSYAPSKPVWNNDYLINNNNS